MVPKKGIALILGYSKTRDALSRHVDSEDKQLICWRPQNVDGNNTQCWSSDSLPQPWGPKTAKCWGTQNGSGNPRSWNTTPTKLHEREMVYVHQWVHFYSLVLSSKMETAKRFKHRVTSQVLPSIRKYGQYKLYDNPYNKMIMIGNETDLHYKVVDMIRRFYPDSILVAGLLISGGGGRGGGAY